MSKKIIIDATHAEETRVALIGNDGRLEDYDIESAARKLLKGNIFLAKVTRVEPSLQAAFVDYGGNRHGFLPFSEIHPDYYRIPIADKEAIMKEEMELRRKLDEAAEAEEDGELDPETAAKIVEELTRESGRSKSQDTKSDKDENEDVSAEDEKSEKPKRGRRKKAVKKTDEVKDEAQGNEDAKGNTVSEDEEDVNGNVIPAPEDEEDDVNGNAKSEDDNNDAEGNAEDGDNRKNNRFRGRGRRGRGGRGGRGGSNSNSNNNRQNASRRPSEVRDDEDFSNPMQPLWNKIRRNYKIQEVIKRGQIMLIQINKEERGNKGAAVTSYITLPGRYCVLMPNSAQGGGVSRKIADRKDRRTMRDILKSLEVPGGMSVILRTAGLTRTKSEIKRDYTYLTRLWNSIRELTLNSSAPSMIHEEGNLLHRIIRDVYSKDFEEIEVAGEEGYKDAKNIMKMMMPSHAKRVLEYKEPTPLFIKHNVEKQIEAVHETTVQLKSGGYLVINPTEALVSVDVNSGRATRERHIEETALKTNLEAAEEVARQMRLRDLAGLVVIDFIDMENRKNNRLVERVLQKALSKDRAKVQCGQISNFGLMELSRQRLRPSMTEKNFIECPHCHGKGIVRTVDGAALTILRAIENEGVQGATGKIGVEAPSDVLLFLLNHKRHEISALESRYGIDITFEMNDEMGASDYVLDVEKSKQQQQPKNQAQHKNQNNRNNNNNNNNNKHQKQPHHQKNEEKAADDAQNDDDQQTSEDKQDKPDHKSRRGNNNNRRRGNNRSDRYAEKGNDVKAASSDDTQKVTDKGDKADNAQAKPADEKPTKGRKPSARTSGRTKSDDVKADSEKTAEASKATPKKAPAKSAKAKDEVKAEEKPAAKKSTKAPTKKAEKATDEKSSSSKSAASNENEAPKGKKTTKAAPKEKTEKVVELSSQPENKPKPAPEYNVISEADGKKKKGWWSRMLE